ncbi:MAG: TetR/AcrR family transcriptional regulator [Rhodobacteraceae bacterium]|nr:TetR/AcrR family transcriptional regulator [Paracoccaceae bacterium]
MVKSPQLSAEDWVLAGFRALTHKGPHALRAEPLARDLKVTKGSFYWHFKDVAAFHDAMLTLWETRAFHDIADALNRIPDPASRLRMLAEISATPSDEQYGGIGAETAIRAWGRSHQGVAEAVRRVDGQRIAYVRRILEDLGLAPDPWARLVYAAYVGLEDQSTRDAADNLPAMRGMVEMILSQAPR